VLDESLLVCDLEQFIDLELSESLNVDGAAFLVDLVIIVRIHHLHLLVLLEIENLRTD
jgi:hypothetical protein